MVTGSIAPAQPLRTARLRRHGAVRSSTTELVISYSATWLAKREPPWVLFGVGRYSVLHRSCAKERRSGGQGLICRGRDRRRDERHLRLRPAHPSEDARPHRPVREAEQVPPRTVASWSLDGVTEVTL